MKKQTLDYLQKVKHYKNLKRLGVLREWKKLHENAIMKEVYKILNQKTL